MWQHMLVFLVASFYAVWLLLCWLYPSPSSLRWHDAAKIKRPATVVTILCVQIDTVRLELSLTSQKLDFIGGFIRSWRSSHSEQRARNLTLFLAIYLMRPQLFSRDTPLCDACMTYRWRHHPSVVGKLPSLVERYFAFQTASGPGCPYLHWCFWLAWCHWCMDAFTLLPVAVANMVGYCKYCHQGAGTGRHACSFLG